MTRARLVLVALIGLVPTAALAHGPNEHPADPNLHVGDAYDDCYVRFASNLTQGAFHRFVEEFGSVSAFKMMSSPRPLGRRRVSVAVEQMAFTVEEHADAWNNTFHHPDAYHELGSDLSFPKFLVRVGLTENLDVGAYWTKNLDANYGWLGLEAKYGALQQSETMPISLAVRGAYTKTLYVEDMDMHAVTADVAAGHTLWKAFTPYVGVGGDVVWARETSDAVALHSETVPVSRAFGGAEVRLWHVELGAEAQFGALTTYQLKVAAVF